MVASPECTVTGKQKPRRHTATFKGVVYDVHKLIEFAKRLPEEHVAIELFENQLKCQFCWDDLRGEALGPDDILTLAQKHNRHWPAMILANPHWAQHIHRVRNAEYDKYPLLVVDERRVIDGMHRLTKAWLDNVAIVKIKHLPHLPYQAIIGERF